MISHTLKEALTRRPLRRLTQFLSMRSANGPTQPLTLLDHLHQHDTSDAMETDVHSIAAMPCTEVTSEQLHELWHRHFDKAIAKSDSMTDSTTPEQYTPNVQRELMRSDDAMEGLDDHLNDSLDTATTHTSECKDNSARERSHAHVPYPADALSFLLSGIRLTRDDRCGLREMLQHPLLASTGSCSSYHYSRTIPLTDRQQRTAAMDWLIALGSRWRAQGKSNDHISQSHGADKLRVDKLTTSSSLDSGPELKPLHLSLDVFAGHALR